MGGESEPVRVRASGGPTRCPFCHEDVAHEREDWVACEACLARHHASCWTEGNGCAGCGDTRFIARTHPVEAPPPIEDVPLFDLRLEPQGDRARFGPGTPMTVHLRNG